MKKTVLTLSVILLTAGMSHAFVDNQYMITEQYLQNDGYSKEAARMIAVTAQDPYREPYVEQKTGKNIARRIYNYIFPGASTDYDFYNHSGSFNTPSWKDY